MPTPTGRRRGAFAGAQPAQTVHERHRAERERQRADHGERLDHTGETITEAEDDHFGDEDEREHRRHAVRMSVPAA